MITGEQHLALAILSQAIEDYRDATYAPEVVDFLNSSWFGVLVDAVDENPHDLLTRIKAEEIFLDNFRKPYRVNEAKRKERSGRQTVTLLAKKESSEYVQRPQLIA